VYQSEPSFDLPIFSIDSKFAYQTGNFTTHSATNPYQNQVSSRSELNELSQRAIEFSSKMSNLERILNATQLGPNNLTIGPISSFAKAKDTSHLHHMYNAMANSSFEATLNEAYINSKKLKNSDFHKYSEHYKIGKYDSQGSP
jgi:hypothetical protein